MFRRCCANSILIFTVSFCFLLNLFSPVNAQEPVKESRSFGERIFFGGNLGLQFGDITFVDISPLVGYRITDQLAAGIGGTYIYQRYRDRVYNYEYSTNIYGGRIFSRYYFVENLFGHAEYEILNLEVPGLNYYVNGELVRENISSFFVGGGYRQMIGERSALEIVLLYNLTEEAYSPYVNPIIRVGFVAGF